MQFCVFILASLGLLLARGQPQQGLSGDDPRRAPLAAAVLAAADALGQPAVGNYALKKGTSDTLGSSNARFRRLAARMVGGELPWSRADAEARSAAADGAQWLPPGPRLSVVGIGGSITSGRMLPDYCKECAPRERYRHVWSGYFKRALEQAIYDATHRQSSSGSAGGSGSSSGSSGNYTTADTHVSGAGGPRRRGGGGVAEVTAAAVGLGSFLGGKAVPRAPGSSAASLAVGHAGHPAATAADPSRFAHAAGAPRAAALGWGDDGWAGQAVRVATHGVNGASVCAFARRARSHVGQWLAENQAHGKPAHNRKLSPR